MERSIEKSIHEVEEKIYKACERAGRDPKEVTLIAVSKTMPVSDLLEAMDAGMEHFGENRPQELRDKQAQITKPLFWHMIGALQTNKLKYVVGKTVLIHSDHDRLSHMLYIFFLLLRESTFQWNVPLSVAS